MKERRRVFELTERERKTILALVEVDIKSGSKTYGRYTEVAKLVFGEEEFLRQPKVKASVVTKHKRVAGQKILASQNSCDQMGKSIPETHQNILKELQYKYPEIFSNATLFDLGAYLIDQSSMEDLINASPRLKWNKTEAQRLHAPTELDFTSFELIVAQIASAIGGDGKPINPKYLVDRFEEAFAELSYYKKKKTHYSYWRVKEGLIKKLKEVLIGGYALPVNMRLWYEGTATHPNHNKSSPEDLLEFMVKRL